MKPLVDPTGSRRFVCVGVTGNIDFGNALNDVHFNFKSKRTSQHMEYWLIEK